MAFHMPFQGVSEGGGSLDLLPIVIFLYIYISNYVILSSTLL